MLFLPLPTREPKANQKYSGRGPGGEVAPPPPCLRRRARSRVWVAGPEFRPAGAPPCEFPSDQPPERVRKAWAWPVAILMALTALDQVTKSWVRAHVPAHSYRPLIPDFIDLTHVENRGVSFSFLGDVPDQVRVPLLAAVTIIAIMLLTYYWVSHRAGMNRWSHLAFLLILPGAAGNLADRLLAGTVTDFLHWHLFGVSLFVNNVADILISAGVISYLIGALVGQRQAR